ncbi:MAG TPA: MFS transporter [Gemmataceae bacterium]|nr:MFS transporter [Gemmataceae bacterium]
MLDRPSSWRWVHVGVAAAAMVATLPGRTHGLGLFTEPIRKTFDLDTETYGFLNLWATLLGGLFCFPCGWLLDRIGTRAVLVGVTVALGATVVIMSGATGAWWLQLDLPGGLSPYLPLDLFVLVLLTRGLGQSALSVASLSLVARSAARREGLAMGAYAFLTTVGFIAAFTVLREVIMRDPGEWRGPWAGIGIAVVVAGVLFLLLVRNRALDQNPAAPGGDPSATDAGHTLGQALRSPAFWVFALATSFYGMVVAGTSLFNEKILAERGLSKEVFLNVTIVGIPAGLAANLLGGWIATRWSLGYLLAAALALFAGALAVFPRITHEHEAYAYAVALAAAGGVITVTFFTVWRRAFGTRQLGRIQGAAQFLTVVFSALGPQLFGSTHTRLGSFAPVFPYLAVTSAALAVAAAVVRLPAKEPE